MATYPTTPVALSTIDETTPTGQEDASKIDDALRQTRVVFKSLLSGIMNDDGSLKTGIALPTGAVTADAIAAGAVTAAKLGTGAVETTKLADSAVTAAKLISHASDDTQRAITADHIKTGILASRHFASGSVLAAALATDAVETAKIKDAAVTEAKLGSGVVTENKLGANTVSAEKLKTGSTLTGTIGRMYFDNGTAVQLLEVHEDSELQPAVAAGKLLLNTTTGIGAFQNAALIEERGTTGGIPAVSAVTGQTPPWGITATFYDSGWVHRPYLHTTPTAYSANSEISIPYDPQSLVTLVEVDSGTYVYSYLRLAKTGTYLANLSAAVFSPGSNYLAHEVRLVDADNLANPVLCVTSIPSMVYQNSQVLTQGIGIFTIKDADTKLLVQHRILQSSSSRDSVLGKGGTFNTADVLMQLHLIKIA